MNKIQNIQNSLINYILGDRAYGRIRKQNLNMIGWIEIDKMYEKTIAKLAHKIMNTKRPEFFYQHFTKDRTIRIIEQNKIAHYPPNFGLKKHERNLFRFRIVNVYNQIPNKLTKMKNYQTFKKWLKKHYLKK